MPDPQTENGLTKIVGKTWNAIVKDETKDVLIKCYAPWCPHCKDLAPVWIKLAKELEGIDDLIVATFEATANEVPGLDFRGFPTIKFYPKQYK